MPPYLYLGSAPLYGGLCESWVETQLLGHKGVYNTPLEALAGASDAVHTSDPNRIPAGVAVVFGAATSNEGLGHSGVSVGGGQIKSVWSNGQIVQEAIAQFSADNGAPLLGYHNFGRGVPASNTAGAAVGPAILAGNLLAGIDWKRVGIGAAAIYAALVVWDAL